MKIKHSFAALAVLFGILLPGLLHAQTATSGAILGAVTDPSGAIVPTAQVRLQTAMDSVAVPEAFHSSTLTRRLGGIFSCRIGQS
jgi:hypothetical protein